MTIENDDESTDFTYTLNSMTMVDDGRQNKNATMIICYPTMITDPGRIICICFPEECG